jgi:hypothetical protein
LWHLFNPVDASESLVEDFTSNKRIEMVKLVPAMLFAEAARKASR